MNFFRRKNVPPEILAPPKADPTAMEASTVEEYLARGLAYHTQGDHKEAEADTRKALAMAPESVDGYFNLGLIFKSQGRADEAREAFKTALEKIPLLEETESVRALMVQKLIKWHIGHVD